MEGFVIMKGVQHEKTGPGKLQKSHHHIFKTKQGSQKPKVTIEQALL